MKPFPICLMILVWSSFAIAHDTWVETNTSLIRVGDVVHIDLKLWNHGNQHRDFKIASKALLGTTQISLMNPDGQSFDLKPQLVDFGLSPKDGYWTTRFIAKQPGFYTIHQTSEGMHGKTRSLKSGKTCFLASTKLDHVTANFTHFDKPVGQTLEIIPITNPVMSVAPGKPVRVKVLFQSRPLKAARVSFVPRGTLLKEGFDDEFERETDADGVATFTPQEGNVILIVVHHSVPDKKPGEYDATTYSSTLTIAVPQVSISSEAAVPSN